MSDDFKIINTAILRSPFLYIFLENGVGRPLGLFIRICLSTFARFSLSTIFEIEFGSIKRSKDQDGSNRRKQCQHVHTIYYKGTHIGTHTCARGA